MASRLSILYVGSRSQEAFLPDGTGEILSCAETPQRAAALKQRPDIVLMDPFEDGEVVSTDKARSWFDAFASHTFKYAPAIFVMVPRETEKKIRMDLMASGADQVVDQLLCLDEIYLNARVFQEKIYLEQALSSKNTSLEKSFGYLDRFKGELKVVKEELFEDKRSLNTALKQIQQMAEERKRLKEGLAKAKKQLTSDMEGFGSILYTLIRQRVEKNRGHGERVAAIARFIAKQMGLSQNKLEDLSKAGMLHETGLLFLSEEQLSESVGSGIGEGISSSSIPAAYDQTLMVQFPVKGAELLEKCQGFEGPAAIIRSLNENCDGTGYPDGLKRHHIPLESRILAGADELESLREKNRSNDIRDLLSGLEPLSGSRIDPIISGWLEKYVVLHLSGETLKVRGVGIESLTPGMELGATLFTKTGTKLFSANTVLTRQAIDKIIQYHRAYPVDETVYVKV